VFFIDSSTYPIARWAQNVSGCLSITVPHFEPEFFHRYLKRNSARRKIRPIVLIDGYCPGCGKLAPIADYIDVLERFNGLLIIDDTQALGILGGNPAILHPLGHGGGGILKWFGINNPNVILISSMAKGLGVPLTMIGGA
jgi:8-amino-7-oxononanoate synthase